MLLHAERWKHDRPMSRAEFEALLGISAHLTPATYRDFVGHRGLIPIADHAELPSTCASAPVPDHDVRIANH